MPTNPRMSLVAPMPRARLSDSWVGSILAVGSVLYLGIGIQVPSLWADEAATVSATQRSWPQLWQLLHNIDAVHGVYYALMKVWLGAVGASPVTLRLPSLLAVGALVATTYAIARRWLDRGTAVAAALICGILPRSTWMGIEGRSWALGALAAAAATLVLLRWVNRPRLPLLAAYCALAAAAIAVNIYSTFLVAAHGISLLLVRLSWRRCAVWLAAAAVASAVATPVILAAAAERAQLGDRLPLTFGDWATSVLGKQFALGDTPAAAPTFMPRWAWSGSAVLVAAITWLLLVWGAYRSAKNAAEPAAAMPWLIPWLLLPPATIGSLGMFGVNLYHPRYFAFTVPAFAIGVACGWAALTRSTLRRAVIVICVILTVPVFWSQRESFSKSGYDWAQAAAVARAATTSGDGVYFTSTPPARMIAFAYPESFSGLVDISLEQTASDEGSLDGSSRPPDPMMLSGAPRRVVGLWSVRSTSRQDELQEFERAGYRPVQEWTGPETALVVLQR